MERELASLIAIKKLPWLVGKDFQVMYQGRPIWTILSKLHGDGTFSGVDEHGNQYPGTIPPDDLRIGRGTRLLNDPILLALQEFKLDWEPYAMAVPGYGAFPNAQNNQAPGPRPQGQAARFGVPPANFQAPGVQIPQPPFGAGTFAD